MKKATLEVLAPILGVLRAHPALQEVRPATFNLNGRGFVHFHEEGTEAVFADVLLARGRVHMPVSSAAEQAELLERVDQVLQSLERRERSRQLGRPKRQVSIKR